MKKHSLWMILCCVLPLLLIAFLPGLRGNNGILRFLPLLLCGVIHLFMMKGLHGRHGTRKNDTCNKTATIPKIKEKTWDNG